MLKNRVIQHVIFWIVAYTVILIFIADNGATTKADHIYTLFVVGCIMPLGYLNTSVLIPRFVILRKYGEYAACIIAAVSLFVVAATLLFSGGIDAVIPRYIYVPILDPIELAFVGVSTITITSLIYFSKSWFYSEQERKQVAILQQQKSEAELMLLKSQLNPHFLFNSLNSIYGLVLKKADTAPEAIVRLSDILRYMVYETSAERVPLQREFEMAEAYIILQRMRLNADQQISLRIKGDTGNLFIAPMLIFQFVENAFKHCSKDSNGLYRIGVSATVEGNKLWFLVSNTIGESTVQRGKGIGLANVKEMLCRIYPNHSLVINVNDDIFSVSLTLLL